MLGFLKKDYNRHSSYNIAVTFFRITAVFAVFTLAVVILRLLYIPPELTPEGEHDFTITKVGRTSISHRRSHTVYYTIDCTDETGAKHSQTVTEYESEIFHEGETYTRPMYATRGGGHFISWGKITDVGKATKEYYERFPDANIVSFRIGIGILAGLTAVNAVIGLGVKRREKKYYEDTAIMRDKSWKGGKQ